jgi:hypothetical protein
MPRSFPEPRNDRKRALATYDLKGLDAAYKVTLRIPLSTDTGHLSREAMIDAILDVEYSPRGRPRLSHSTRKSDLLGRPRTSVDGAAFS